MQNSLSLGYLPRTVWQKVFYLMDIKTVFNCRGWVILTDVLTNLETHEPLKYCVVTNLNKDQDAS